MAEEKIMGYNQFEEGAIIDPSGQPPTGENTQTEPPPPQVSSSSTNDAVNLPDLNGSNSFNNDSPDTILGNTDSMGIDSFPPSPPFSVPETNKPPNKILQ